MVPIYDIFDSADLGLYGGFVVISGGDQTYRVPFMGLKGDYTKMNVLGSISYGSIDKRANAPHFDFPKISWCSSIVYLTNDSSIGIRVV